VTSAGNRVSSNTRAGVSLSVSANVTISATDLSSNAVGMSIDSSSNITLTANNVSNNGYGIGLVSSTYVTITANTFLSNGVYLQGDSVSYFNSHTIPTDNTVNGKPLYYHKDCSGLTVDGIPVGQLIVANCTSVIAANLQITDSDVGIEMAFSTGVTITATNVSGNEYGISLDSSVNVTLIANDVTSNRVGVYPHSSTNITLTANNLSSNLLFGLYVHSSTSIAIAANDASSNVFYGIHVELCTNVSIATNNVSNSDYGISLSSSTGVTITANIASSNSQYGIYIGASSNVTLAANRVSNSGDGIYLASSTNITVAANIVSNSFYGIYLDTSTSVAITANNVSNSAYGIYLYFATSSAITANNVSNASYGIYSYFATSIAIASNVLASSPYDGIYIAFSTSIAITANSVSNASYGIHLRSSADVAITTNSLSDNRVGIYVMSSRDIPITANTILARSNSYGIHLDSSTSINVTANSVSASSYGIYIEWSDDVTINADTFSASWIGVYVTSSRDIIATSNTILGNERGIHLGSSINVTIHHNGIISNGVQAWDDSGSENRWDDGYPSGGNYWSDYAGADDCRGPAQDICPGPDGLGDTPYVIDADSQDRYPLLAPPGGPRPPQLLAAELSGAGLEDLNLTWRGSWDESRPNGTNAYRILRAPSLSGPYSEIASVPADGSLNYTFTCLSCGHVPGDTNLTFYRVQAVSATNRTADSNVAARYARPVQPGMNLLSIPLEQTDYAVQAVLRTFAHGTVRTYDAADAVDPWKAFYPARSGDLAQTTFGGALWVDVTAPGQYTVAGLVRANPSFALSPGWNLVAYASFLPEAAGASLAGVPGVSRVEAFDPSPGATPYRLRAVPMAELLVPGEAYWVYVTGAGGVWVQG